MGGIWITSPDIHHNLVKWIVSLFQFYGRLGLSKAKEGTQDGSAGGARSSVRTPSSRALAFTQLCSTVTDKCVCVGGWQLSAPIYTQGNPCSLEVRSDTQGPTAKLQSRDSKLSLLVPNFAHPAGSQEYAEEHHGHRKGQSGRAGALLKQKALS